MKTIQDALAVYQTFAKAEGKSPETLDWVTSSVGYFAEFLGPGRQEFDGVTGDDLRRFIIALKDKPRYSNHPYSKPQSTKLSPKSVDNYCRGVAAFFAFLEREGFLIPNPLQKVKMMKLPKVDHTHL